jgi:hypothetical protein
MRDGACADVAEPALSFTVHSRKHGGMTAGFVATDATGRRFALKFDQDEVHQPGLSTAADAIVSRLYWAIGYNTPCNRIANLHADEIRVAPDASETDEYGVRRPIDATVIARTFASRVHRADGTVRIGVSHFIEGEPLGPWSPEGQRDDDPNDTIPHERRRALRAERLLAAWVSHWDARSVNAFDTWIRVGEGRGFVRHYQIDFGDALGVHPIDVLRADRQGFEYTIPPGMLLADFATFGAIHRPWDDAGADAVLPMLGVGFDVRHFDPNSWVPSNPSPRFDAATPQDLAWMARRIALIGPDELRAALESGRFDDARAVPQLMTILLGRRLRSLRSSFRDVSPLAHVAVRREGLCARDLAIVAAVTNEASVQYLASIDAHRGQHGTSVRRLSGGLVCAALPANVASSQTRDDSPSRYAVVEVRRDEGRHHTRLRAHLYDLGAQGWGRVGLERPD